MIGNTHFSAGLDGGADRTLDRCVWQGRQARHGEDDTQDRPDDRNDQARRPAGEGSRPGRGRREGDDPAAQDEDGPDAATAEQPAWQGSAGEPTHDEIALRAWSIYQQRGASHGQAMSDWLEARNQLCLERGLKP